MNESSFIMLAGRFCFCQVKWRSVHLLCRVGEGSGIFCYACRGENRN